MNKYMLKCRLQSSSIAEVVTAMLLISLSMALASMLLSDIFGSSGRYMKHKAWFAVNEYVNMTRLSKSIETTADTLPGIILDKSAIRMEGNPDLWEVIIKATSNEGKLLVMRRFAIELPENSNVGK